jgi:putative FmdB family regulatory protein
MIYEYECLTCHETVEAKQSVKDSPKRLLFCPGCGKVRAVKKLISKTSFILKGSGWAKDGYNGGNNE